MGIFLLCFGAVGVIFLITALSWAIRYPTLAVNAIKTFPRDARGLSKYARIMVCVYYYKWMDLKVSQKFDKTVAKHPEKTCFFFEDEEWSFQKVQEMTLKMAKYFQSRGYVKGDVVGLFMESRPEFVCIWLGLSRIGVVTSFINYNLRLSSLEHCIRASKCKGLIFGTELTNAIEELAHSPSSEELVKQLELFSFADRQEPDHRLSVRHKDLTLELKSIDASTVNPREFGKDIHASDIAIHIFTSGTTGLPKAVLMTHSRLFTYASAYYATSMAPSDILLTPIPLYHVQGGLVGVTIPLLHGISQVIVRKFSASNFWKICIKYEVTYCQYMGEVLRYIYNQPERPEDREHKVRIFFGNGVNAAIWEKFVKRFDVKINEIYGSTEGNCSVMNVDGHVGAVTHLPILLLPFLPLMMARVDPMTGDVIRDPKTGLVISAKINEPFEAVVKIVQGNPLREFNGYTDDEATRKKIISDVIFKGDSYYRSGDLFRIDSMGYVYFLDRTGETYKWKGENVSTAEVEEVFLKATDYKTVAVYGVPVPNCDGKCGMATISDPLGTLDLHKIAVDVIKHLPSYARPIFIRICDTEIQMTGTFKLQKTQLQKEGFDLNLIKHPIYFLQKDKYVPLNKEIYDEIIAGKIRL